MRLSVTAGTSTGKPANSTARRPTLAALFAGLRDAAGDHVFDLGRIDLGTLTQAGQRTGQQSVGTNFAKRAVAASKRRPHGFDDNRLWHD